MARYFITGATGFIGGYLCRLLDAAGHPVTALVRSPHRAKNLPESVKILHGDLSLFADAKTTLPEFDIVIHLAGVVTAPSPALYEAINYQSVVDLVSCLGRQSWTPRRMLFASSLAAAGPSGEQAWTELDTLAPIDPYGEAKARAEPVVQQASFPTTTFRPPIVLGAGDPASLTLFKAGRSRLGLKVAGDAQRLSFVDVRDLCDAIVLMAEDTRDGSFTYFTSHPDEIDSDRLWASMSSVFGHRIFTPKVPHALLFGAMKAATTAAKFVPFNNQLDEKQYRQLTAPGFVCDSSALRSDLGWAPKHNLESSLADAVEGYRALGML